MIRAIVEFFADRKQKAIDKAYTAGMVYAKEQLSKDRNAGDRLWSEVWGHKGEPFDEGVMAILQDQGVRDPSIPEGYDGA